MRAVEKKIVETGRDVKRPRHEVLAMGKAEREAYRKALKRQQARRYYERVGRERFLADRRESRARTAGSRRDRQLRAVHKMTREEFAALLASQGGGCAICGRSDAGSRWPTLHIDHDHETGKRRGLLCHRCNLALGHMQDDPDRLERAAAYLRSHR